MELGQLKERDNVNIYNKYIFAHLTHLFLIQPLSNPWKHQKTVRKTSTPWKNQRFLVFSEVEKGCIGNKCVKTLYKDAFRTVLNVYEWIFFKKYLETKSH